MLIIIYILIMILYSIFDHNPLFITDTEFEKATSELNM